MPDDVNDRGGNATSPPEPPLRADSPCDANTAIHTPDDNADVIAVARPPDSPLNPTDSPPDSDEEAVPDDESLPRRAIHSEQNPDHPVIPVRPRKKQAVIGRAQRRVTAATTQKKAQALAAELRTIGLEREGHAMRLATKYKLKISDARASVAGAIRLKPQRKANSNNARLSFVLKRFNAGTCFCIQINHYIKSCPDKAPGEKMTMMELHKAAKDDETILDLTPEEMDEALAMIKEKRAVVRNGTRATKAAAARDGLETAKRLIREVSHLRRSCL
jgi:hypothetical protein